MNVFKWFDIAEIDELAPWMAEELAARVSPAVLDLHEKKAVVKLRNAQDAVFDRARKLSPTQELNIDQKAGFGNQFRDAGYPWDFVESWTRDLITALATHPATGQSADGSAGKFVKGACCCGNC